MKKTLIGMMSVAVMLPLAMAQENEKQEQKKEVETPTQSYDVILEKQMKERIQAFNQDHIQKDPKALAMFLEKQRNRVIEWEKQQSRAR